MEPASYAGRHSQVECLAQGTFHTSLASRVKAAHLYPTAGTPRYYGLGNNHRKKSGILFQQVFACYPVLPNRSDARDIGPGASINPDRITFADKSRDLHFAASLDSDFFRHACSCIAAYSHFCPDDLQVNAGRQLNV